MCLQSVGQTGEPSLSLSLALSLFLSVVVVETRFYCSFGACPGAQCVYHGVLELTEICLFLPPKCWD